MTSKWTKFRLLFWKNWLLQRRHPSQSAVEIIVPVIFCAILLIIRALVTVEQTYEPTTYSPFLPSALPSRLIQFSSLSFENPRMPGECRNLTSDHTVTYNLDGSELVTQTDILACLLEVDSKCTSCACSQTMFFNVNYILNKLGIRGLPESNDVEVDICQLECGIGVFSSCFPWLIGWTGANNTVLQNIMDLISTDLQFTPVYFPTEEALVETLTNHLNVTTGMSSRGTLMYLAGIVFEGDFTEDDQLPLDLTIKIRFPGEVRHGESGYLNTWFTKTFFSYFQLPGPREPEDADGGFPGYNREGFLGLQDILSSYVLKYHATTLPTSLPEIQIYLNRYPYPEYLDDPLMAIYIDLVPIIIVLSFVYNCTSTVRTILTEKEKQLRESMKMMGLPGWLHYLAWFTQLFIFSLISFIIILMLFKIPFIPGGIKVLQYSDWSCILVFFIIYAITSITFCFFLSACFSKASSGAILGGVLWYITYVPYMFIEQIKDTPAGVKLATSLLSNTALCHAFNVIFKYEGMGEGLQWSNMWTPPSSDLGVTMGQFLGMLIADAVLYMLLTVYIEGVFPGEFGVPLPFYFPFTKRYWCGADLHENEELYEHDKDSQEFFEREPNLKAGISIRHLRKVYGNEKVAVDNLNLNMYEGQITVLLGHNGAGKTTTMSMLTGLYTPTSGTAIVNGHDIRTDMEGVRTALGLCPQHNVLFSELTVKEHIQFFGELKGLKKHEIEAESEKYIKLLELEPKADYEAGKLSGGMQRKLAVAVALCGKSKVVLLDEPTSGMDPSARRALWDLLQQEKEGRTILLSTHFMDEADLLGDRIAIMASGKLKCCGSSFFLKKKYSGGYRLTMVKTTECEPDKVTRFLQNFIPELETGSNIGSELSYYLEEKYANIYEKILTSVEEKHTELGILSYGVSSSTIEDVFMACGGDESIEHEPDIPQPPLTRIETLDNIYSGSLGSSTQLENGRSRLLKGLKLTWNQIWAMFYKYFLSTIRSWKLYLFIIIIPILALSITIGAMQVYDLEEDLPAKTLDLPGFRITDSIATCGNTSDISDIVSLKEKYQEFFKGTGQIIDIGDKNMTTFVLDEMVKDEYLVEQKYTVGAVFEGTDSNISITGWFNNQPLHAVPMALNYAYNALYKYYLGDSYGVHIVNAPLPFSIETKIDVQQSGFSVGYQIAANVGFCSAFIAAYFILILVNERVTRAKLLQFVSGVNYFVYWITYYIWCLVAMMGPIAAILITITCFQVAGFSSPQDIGRVFLVLLLFSFAILPIVFLCSFGFDVPAAGFARMSVLNMILGLLTFIIVSVLLAPALDTRHVGKILDWVFSILPNYSLCNSLYLMSTNFYQVDLCITQQIPYPGCRNAGCNPEIESCLDYKENYFDWEQPGIGRFLVFFAIDFAVFSILLVLVEARVWEMLVYSQNTKVGPLPSTSEDSDVLRERIRIQEINSDERMSYNLLLQGVTKYYDKFLAVNNLCLGVQKGECFGLLGVNGAGKTTTFKMLTGDEKISFGDAFVYGLSLKYDMKSVYQQIGYCPQFDALIGDLTGRETLKIYCLLRGVHKNEIQYTTEKLAKELLFYQHLDKPVKAYSGGNKRKLSTALALVGDPPVIYLDEPTTGMDPVAKRHLWNVISKIRSSGKTIILTSHSMEECEALCTRLAIMVNGEFKCLGSTQHLKNKFAQGYTLTVKVRKSKLTNPRTHVRTFSGISVKSVNSGIINEADLVPVKTFIEDSFRGAECKEEYQGLLTYHIPQQDNMSWPKMFGLMESAKRELNIEDYSLGQTSLEQVFLSFTKYQRGDNIS